MWVTYKVIYQPSHRSPMSEVSCFRRRWGYLLKTTPVWAGLLGRASLDAAWLNGTAVAGADLQFGHNWLEECVLNRLPFSL